MIICACDHAHNDSTKPNLYVCDYGDWYYMRTYTMLACAHVVPILTLDICMCAYVVPILTPVWTFVCMPM